MPLPRVDLEQLIFDLLASHIDAANELSSDRQAVENLDLLATHCEVAAGLARAGKRLIDAATSHLAEGEA